ncbi:hypothetical protein OG21DRAFT_127952 [Imleria badia]|nr:hypothetical protein OG21DRAFT_127952 [Imleria badia]
MLRQLSLLATVLLWNSTQGVTTQNLTLPQGQPRDRPRGTYGVIRISLYSIAGMVLRQPSNAPHTRNACGSTKPRLHRMLPALQDGVVLLAFVR